MARKLLAVLCLPLFLVFALPSQAKTYKSFVGKVVGITDGDTLSVLVDTPEAKKQEVKIRLNGIDSPESHQDFGSKAKEHASSLAFGKTVSVNPKDKDRYGRIVADVILPEGENLNHEMVKAGMAWWYEKYAPTDKELSKLQEDAKRFKVGLWSQPNPIPPWEFRRPKSSVPSPSISSSTQATQSQVFITKTGKKYHLAGCRYLSKSQIPISLSDAKAKGFQPCSVCNPPSALSEKPGNPNSPQSKASVKNDSASVYVNGRDTKFHASDCPLVQKDSLTPLSMEDAFSKGLGPCSSCAHLIVGGKKSGSVSASDGTAKWAEQRAVENLIQSQTYGIDPYSGQSYGVSPYSGQSYFDSPYLTPLDRHYSQDRPALDGYGAISPNTGLPKTNWVEGGVDKNGKYRRGHWRSR